MQASLRETLARAFRALTPQESAVLRMRFGLDDNDEHTLEQVGQAFELTRERIRQIEGKAIEKLKHPARSKVLRAFVDKR